jgi:hypothetical protein
MKRENQLRNLFHNLKVKQAQQKIVELQVLCCELDCEEIEHGNVDDILFEMFTKIIGKSRAM